MDSLLQDFLAETSDKLGALDLDLVRLEKNPKDGELIGRIFRLVHTMKGNCGFLGLPRLENVAHHAENVLGQYRSGVQEPSVDSVSVILQSLDRIREIVGEVARTGHEPPGDDGALITLLDLASRKKTPVAAAPSFGRAAAEEAARKSLRVNVDTLSSIMEAVGELVQVKNRFTRSEGTVAPEDMRRFHRAVACLQRDVMKARMQPISGLWDKMPRMVRDIAIDTNRKIRLDMEGAATEIDRQMLELLRDPLTHLVRNAAGHGIEKPAERALAGKNPEGIVRLFARHEGGQVIVEVSDDGRGLDAQLIGRKAVEKGLVTEEKLAHMDARTIRKFIFAPGFSTAEQVTNLQGRGMGLDIVRADIEKTGGSIDVSSTPGRGTAFTLRIPLTIAILQALVVEVEGEAYALPQNTVEEVVRLSRNSPHRLEKEKKSGQKFLHLRGDRLPVLSLQGPFGIDARAAKSLNPHVAVVNQSFGRFGIIVDAVTSSEELVVKPLAPVLHGRLFSGCAVMGDGRVVLILDPARIAEAAGVEPR